MQLRKSNSNTNSLPIRPSQVRTALNRDKQGFVSLVGAGPGDPELLTLKALKAIQSADVILHDHLVTKAIIQNAKPGTNIIEVGKSYNNPSATQEGINTMLVSMAQRGLRICRLKGGDPFVFGRGSEEAIALEQQQIPFEVVPGLTAALGCCAYSGIPLTHRGVSRGFTAVTARGNNEQYQINWESLVKLNHTLVFYMGLHCAAWIASSLMLHGMSKDTPIAIISHGTQPQHHQLSTTLIELENCLLKNTPTAPSLIVVGETVDLANQIKWHSNHQQTEHLFEHSLEGAI
ncbi:uroporphyrinogen-III C-methyltransferase [Photobacterium rosenbergii]|uniref:uroporphyrinogen-III C-methyltransferase n=1 Tax=Photobacterium rosenbergii TaxID=294936 RepID=A0A2T3NC20_9GAMM|nr:uroporphyrinogen-III C-methyltransferase [Photobacterium rosenbergii]PSW11517.1 uroporphyrinogen-III C-methyltransferase [Photobacterium rosenbergii]